MTTPTRKDDRTLWRRLPVFIASTFRDMDSERDIINRIVIPSVNARLAAAGRGITVYPVDLRWGVEADHRLDEATRERVILQTCVSEVRRCRPLFLGILGTKYGGVDLGSRISELAAEFGVADVGFPLSVTALEMLIATQSGVEDGFPPVILSRRVPLADREASVAAGALDDLPGSAGAEYLRELEDHLRAQGCVLLDYESQWNPKSARLESEGFADLAVEQLVGMVERIAGDTDAADWLQMELNAQHWFAQREVAQFVGRDRELDFVRKFWSQNFIFGEFGDVGDDTKNPMHGLRRRMHNGMLGVLGDSGCGKSALLAKVALDIEIFSWGESITKRPAPRAFCSAGVTVASTQLPVCLLVLLAQINPAAAFSIAERATPYAIELEDVLEVWIETLAGGLPMFGPLIVFDGIDRLTGSLIEGRSTAWMTTMLADRVRFLVSAESGSSEAEILRLRPLTNLLELGDLEAEDAEALIRNRMSAYHRAIPEQVVAVLVARSRVPRWLALATEVLLTLMRNDYLILMNSDVELDPQQAIRQLLVEISAALPPDLVGLHAEVLERLSELSDHWFGALLGILDTAMFGLRGSDIFAMLGPGSPGEAAVRAMGIGGGSAVDLALARDLLTGIVVVDHDEWTFAHVSASRAVGQIMDEASDWLELNRSQVRIGNKRLLVAYLLSLPVEDPVRTRELLIQLFWLGENRGLVRILADPQLSTMESVTVFASLLVGYSSGHSVISDLKDLMAAAETGAEVLTVAAVLILVMQVLSPEHKHELAGCLRTAVLNRAGPEARSRTGSDSDDVLVTIDLLVQDPLNFDRGSRIWIFQDWGRSVVAGRASLRDLPEFGRGGKVEAATTMQVEMSAIIAYALMAITDEIPAPGADDAAVAAATLDYWRESNLDLQALDQNLREYLDLSHAVACRAARAMWPAAVSDGVVESDFMRTAHLSDRLRGLPDVVVLLSRCVRSRMTEFLAVFLAKDEIEESDAELGYEILQQIDEALWHLDIHRELQPDNVLIDMERVQLLQQKSVVLSFFDQDASACRALLEACQHPHLASVFGITEFIDLAVDSLGGWCEHFVDIDPSPVLESLLDLVNGQTGDLLPDEPGRVDVTLVLSALQLTQRFGPSELADSVIDRFLERSRAGAIPLSPGLLDDGEDLPDIVRAFLEDLEEELISEFEKHHEEILGSGHEEDTQALLQIIQWMYDLRTRLSTTHPDDLLGAALSATMHFAVSGVQEWRLRSLDPLPALITHPELGERANRIMTVVYALHSSGPDQIDWKTLR